MLTECPIILARVWSTCFDSFESIGQEIDNRSHIKQQPKSQQNNIISTEIKNNKESLLLDIFIVDRDFTFGKEHLCFWDSIGE